MSILHSSRYLHELEISQELCKMGRIILISERRKLRLKEASDVQIPHNY